MTSEGKNQREALTSSLRNIRMIEALSKEVGNDIATVSDNMGREKWATQALLNELWVVMNGLMASRSTLIRARWVAIKMAKIEREMSKT